MAKRCAIYCPRDRFSFRRNKRLSSAKMIKGIYVPPMPKMPKKKKTKCFFPNHEMCHFWAVKMRIAPCEVEMFCPKCGLIKENVVFFSQPFLDKKQKSKRALLAQKGQILFTTYNAKFLILVFINWAGCCGLSRFEWICRFWQKRKYSFYISIIIDFVTFGKTSEQRPQIHKGT